jgi:hypothetical protein
MAKEKEGIDLPEIKVKRFNIRIVGDTPFIVHAWSEKAKKEMLDVQTGKPKKAREPKNPVADFINSMYWLTPMPKEMTEKAFEDAVKKGAKFGMPVVMFKKAAANGARLNGAAKFNNEVFARMWIMGDEGEFATINGKPKIVPVMREDMVRIGGATKVADLRYRGEFKNWSVELTVSINSGITSIEEVVNYLNLGGFSAGVGEWRINKGGIFGAYHCEA